MTAPRCLDCDRPLKDPESRDRGYGPDCWRSRQPSRAGSSPRVTTVRAVRIFRRSRADNPDQLELDLQGAET